LFNGLGEDGRIFVNVDDVHLKPFSEAYHGAVTYGVVGDADYQAKPLAQDQEGKWKIEIAGTQIQLSLPGRHNIYNAVAAAAVAGSYGVSMETVKIALEDFSAHDKRMQVLQAGGVTLINDTYNANPDSMTAALRVLAEWECSGRKIAVLADMLELGAVSLTEHQNVGQMAVELGLDKIYGFGPFTEALIAAARLTVGDKALHFNKKSALIDNLKKTVNPGDVVLIKGSRGMTMEEVIEALLPNEVAKRNDDV
ncbi:UDP-N-acetylmuramoyl-tripeptide--D-alanyl-D-alanine ligase, partial [bacterium]|nr:UDP-N-acetylmuramoyl-tripeptide--D-alanyl-D-alanine ligase [bacterium]